VTARLALVFVLVVALGHLVAPFLVVLVAAEVLAFALACVALGWLLAATRLRWRLVAPAGKAGPR
jgi:hypothetical protein